jgi:predicted RecA/RadA family phage recombinase
MKNFVQPGDRLTLTAPYTVTSGSLVFVGAIGGVALHDAASAASVTVQTDGVHDLVHAVTNTAAAIGDVAYFDTTNRAISATTTFARAGVYVSAKVTTSTAVRVRLNGSF